MPPLITLTTDFGLQDPFVGIMKGVILAIAPQARLIDLTHEIRPQDVLGAALALESAADYFPAGAIHLAVVDPGVGSSRAALAVQTDRFTLVGPDNGIGTLVLARHPPVKIVRLVDPRFRLAKVSATFHGRDIFAPAAAHLALGTPIEEFGPIAEQLVCLTLPTPEADGQHLHLHVLATDHFGNLITDLTESTFRAWTGPTHNVEVVAGRDYLGPIRQTFSEVPPGKPLAYFGSGGRLEIAVREGRAEGTVPQSIVLRRA